MIDRILQKLAYDGILPSPERSRYLYIFNNRANINLLLFDRETKVPLLFIKISDLRNFHEVFAAIKSVYAISPNAVPQPVCVFSIDGYDVLVTKAYRMKLLAGSHNLSSNKQQRILENALERLTTLHSKTRRGTMIIDVRYCETVLMPVAVQLFNQWQDYSLFRQFQRYLQILERSDGIVLPRIPQHGDLVVFNTCLVDGRIDQIMFIDWDSYGKVELATYDLSIFLLTFANLYGQGLYFHCGLTDRIRSVATDYCQVMGIDPQFLKLLYPACLLSFAGLKLDIGIYNGQAFAYKELKRYFSETARFVFG